MLVFILIAEYILYLMNWMKCIYTLLTLWRLTTTIVVVLHR